MRRPNASRSGFSGVSSRRAEFKPEDSCAVSHFSSPADPVPALRKCLIGLLVIGGVALGAGCEDAAAPVDIDYTGPAPREVPVRDD